MPVRIQDAGNLPELRDNPVDRLLGHASNIHPDVQNAGGTPLGDDSARQKVQVLKSLKNSGQSAGIGLGCDTKGEDWPIWMRHDMDSGYAQKRTTRVEATPPRSEAGRVMSARRPGEVMQWESTSSHCGLSAGN
jgi:hypothetical protein